MGDLQLISIWNAKRDQNQYIQDHSHNYHELVYYPSGKGKTEIGGKSFLFSEHCFTLIPPGTSHNETHHTGSQVLCLGFSGAVDLPSVFYTDQNRGVYKILKELLREVNEQNYGYEDMLTIKLHELLLLISRNNSNPLTTKNFAYIINYLCGNFHEHINLSDCARQLNISYDYFQHKFKDITGYSPQQFLINQRLQAAEKMLKETGCTCTEIACCCGFCNSAQFSAMFKQRYGITPLQYKKRHTQKA